MNSYLKTFLYVSVAVFMAIGLMSYALDPFGMFRGFGLRTDYLLGERIWEDQRKVKDLSLDRLHPDTLITGNSRVQKGFNVYDPALEQRLGYTHNLGLNGANFDEMDYYTRLVMRGQVPRTLIVGLDIGQFTEAGRSDNAEVVNFKFLQDIYGVDMVKRFSYALWSSQAIKAWESVLQQPHSLTIRGTPNFDEELKYLMTFGYRRVTLRAEYNVANRLRMVDWNAYERRMRLMDALIADACLQGTVIKLFISPVHVRHLVLLNEMELTEKSFQWKRTLTEIVGRHQVSGCDVALLDFGHITTYTTEPFPDMDNQAYSMQWYWDSGHYKPALGFLILQRLFHEAGSSTEFGINLTPASIEQSVKAEKTALYQFIHEHPDIVNDVRRAIVSDKVVEY